MEDENRYRIGIYYTSRLEEDIINLQLTQLKILLLLLHLQQSNRYKKDEED